MITKKAKAYIILRQVLGISKKKTEMNQEIRLQQFTQITLTFASLLGSNNSPQTDENNHGSEFSYV